MVAAKIVADIAARSKGFEDTKALGAPRRTASFAIVDRYDDSRFIEFVEDSTRYNAQYALLPIFFGDDEDFPPLEELLLGHCRRFVDHRRLGILPHVVVVFEALSNRLSRRKCIGGERLDAFVWIAHATGGVDSRCQSVTNRALGNEVFIGADVAQESRDTASLALAYDVEPNRYEHAVFAQ